MHAALTEDGHEPVWEKEVMSLLLHTIASSFSFVSQPAFGRQQELQVHKSCSPGECAHILQL